MPFYEFECTRGHVTEKLVPIGTAQIICPTCQKIDEPYTSHIDGIGFRILSPTPTTFVAAGGRKL